MLLQGEDAYGRSGRAGVLASMSSACTTSARPIPAAKQDFQFGKDATGQERGGTDSMRGGAYATCHKCCVLLYESACLISMAMHSLTTHTYK